MPRTSCEFVTYDLKATIEASTLLSAQHILHLLRTIVLPWGTERMGQIFTGRRDNTKEEITMHVCRDDEGNRIQQKHCLQHLTGTQMQLGPDPNHHMLLITQFITCCCLSLVTAICALMSTNCKAVTELSDFSPVST